MYISHTYTKHAVSWWERLSELQFSFNWKHKHMKVEASNLISKESYLRQASVRANRSHMLDVSDVVFKKIRKSIFAFFFFLSRSFPKEVVVNLLFNSLTVFMCVIDVNVLYYLIDARYLLVLCIKEVHWLNYNHRVCVISQSHGTVKIKSVKLELPWVRGVWLSVTRSAQNMC